MREMAPEFQKNLASADWANGNHLQVLRDALLMAGCTFAEMALCVNVVYRVRDSQFRTFVHKIGDRYIEAVEVLSDRIALDQVVGPGWYKARTGGTAHLVWQWAIPNGTLKWPAICGHGPTAVAAMQRLKEQNPSPDLCCTFCTKKTRKTQAFAEWRPQETQ